MAKTIISTAGAPAAIGTYSQAVKVGDTVYLSGQIGLDPQSGQLVDGIDAQIIRVFDNLKAVAEAAGGSLADVVKLNIYLTDLGNFAKVNETMAKYFRAAVSGARRRRRCLAAAWCAGRGRCGHGARRSNALLRVSDGIKAPPALQEKPAKLGLVRRDDLVLHLPLRYEDETLCHTIADAPWGEPVQIEAQVVDVSVQYRPRRQLVARVRDESSAGGELVLRFPQFLRQPDQAA